MKHILRIYDFIRSWFYYPKMQKYLNSIGIEYRTSRLQYALWHCKCKVGKLSDIGHKNSKPTVKSIISNGWKCAYLNEPLERKRGEHL